MSRSNHNDARFTPKPPHGELATLQIIVEINELDSQHRVQILKVEVNSMYLETQFVPK
jgi:hypothetical protein